MEKRSMNEITDERIDKAIKRKATPVGFTIKGVPTVKIDVFQAVQDAHDFALKLKEVFPEIRRLRKREEDARGLLEEVQWSHGPYNNYCPLCDGVHGSHAPDCDLAAWLKGE